MALINCPECNTQVSDKAKECPKCAFPINSPEVVKEEVKVAEVAKEGCFLQTLNTGCLVFFGILLGIIVLMLLAGLLS